MSTVSVFSLYQSAHERFAATPNEAYERGGEDCRERGTRAKISCLTATCGTESDKCVMLMVVASRYSCSIS